MRLVFAQQAIANLDNINRWISADRPMAAAKVARRLQAAAALLASAPYIGRRGSVSGTRELVVRGFPYILVYTVDESVGTVLIVNVLHGAQDRGQSAR